MLIIVKISIFQVNSFIFLNIMWYFRNAQSIQNIQHCSSYNQEYNHSDNVGVVFKEVEEAGHTNRLMFINFVVYVYLFGKYVHINELQTSTNDFVSIEV